MDTAPSTTLTETRVIETDSGPVTLEELPFLRSRIATLKAQAEDMLDKARSLRALADDRVVDLGKFLIDSSEWKPPAELSPLTQHARDLRSRIDADATAIESLRTEERHGFGGALGRVRAWNESRKLVSDRVSSESQLRAALLQLGQNSGDIQPDTARRLRQQADAAGEQAHVLEDSASQLGNSAQRLQDEAARREAAQREMGFDAPYFAAYLKAFGPQPVTSPLTLQHGERAVAVLPARLARQQTRTHYVGGSQGFSFPIGHTGIRYRVGSFHGHPVQQQLLATLDTGALVITDQRIAFVGQAKVISIALGKLLHVQCYSDGLAVFHQGREDPDFFLTAQPKYALFMLNWAAAQPG